MGTLSYLPAIKELEAKISKGEDLPLYETLENRIPILKAINEKLERQEEELKIANNALNDLFRYSSIGICEIGLDGHFLSVNDAWCKMCHRTEEELLKLTWMDITVDHYIEPDGDYVKKLMDREIDSYTMYKEYFYFENKVQKIIPIILTVSCVFNRKGEVEKFISQAVDLDNLCRLGKELRKKS